jgi:hypothetical protein
MEATSARDGFPPTSNLRFVGIITAVMMIMARVALAQQVVEHFPIPSAEANKSIPVEARITAPGRAVVYARVYYKGLSQPSFRYADMRPAAGGYTAAIPATVVRPPVVQYFILILLTDQTVFTYPDRNPYGQPFEINVNEAPRRTPAPPVTPSMGGQQTTPGAQPATPQMMEKLQRLESQPSLAEQPDTLETFATEMSVEDETAPILALSPEPFAKLAASEVVITASFMNEVPVDSASIRVTLDKQDITEDGEVSPLIVSITPQQDILPGEHRVVITANDIDGNTLAPLSWRFSVVGEESVEVTARRASASGVVYAESRQEKFSGIKLSNNNLGANLAGGYGALNYSGQVYITSLEDAAFQPRNRFSFTAGTSWLNFSVGDINPRFDELILWGQRVRGIGAGIRLGSIFNVDFVTGATNRRVAAQYIPGTTTLLRSGTFERKLTGIRPSFGGGKHFQWGITLLKVRDQISSLKAGESSVTPRDNLVAGTDLLIAANASRIELKASAAVSLLSNDITNGPLSQQQVKDQFDVELPFDPSSIQDFFILNESTTPLDPTGGGSLAYQVTLRLNYFNNFLQLGYKNLGGEYFSLGNTFLRNDVRGFFAYDRLRLFRNRVYLNFGLERYDEHFSQIDNTPKIDLNAFSYGFSVFWGQNLPSLNFNMRNYRRDNNIDSLGTGAVPQGENALTRDFSASINYDVVLFDLNHTLALNVTSSNRADEFAGQRVAAGLPPGNLNSNVQLVNVRTRYNFPLTTTATFARNSNNVAGGQNTLKYNLLSGRGEYAMLQEKLKLYGGLRFISASGVGASTGVTQSVVDYKQTAFQLGGSYQFATAHLLTLDFDLIKFNNAGGTLNLTTNTLTKNPSFNDYLVRAYYEFRF